MGWICNIRGFCNIDLQDPAMLETRRCCPGGALLWDGTVQVKGEKFCILTGTVEETKMWKTQHLWEGRRRICNKGCFGQMGSAEERLGRKARNLSGMLQAQPTEATECVTLLLTSFHNVPCMLCVASKQCMTSEILIKTTCLVPFMFNSVKLSWFKISTAIWNRRIITFL